MAQAPLPPLPPSDGESMYRNSKARAFWDGAEIISIPDKPAPKCSHEFINNEGGIRCKKCAFGLLGSQLTAKNGLAYAQGEPIRFS